MGRNSPTHDNLSVAKLEDYGKDYKPKRYELGAYKPFSVYPFIVRDVALWVLRGTEVPVVEKVIIGISTINFSRASINSIQIRKRWTNVVCLSDCVSSSQSNPDR